MKFKSRREAIAGATGQVDTFENDDDWATAFRVLRRLFLRIQLRALISNGVHAVSQAGRSEASQEVMPGSV